MKIYKLIIFFISLSISMQGQEAWTLEQCIKRAIEKNISIKDPLNMNVAYNQVKDLHHYLIYNI